MKIYLKGSVAASVDRLFGDMMGLHARPQATNLSGLWKLSIEKSEFGGAAVPRSIEVSVEHDEPSIRYSGTFIDLDGTSASFEFEAILDRSLISSNGVTISATRVDSNTTRFEWKSEDTQLMETTVMTVSEDAHVLTVNRHVERPEGAFGCTEVYEQRVLPKVEFISGEKASRNLWRPRAFGTGTLDGAANAMAKIGLPEGAPSE
jgi:hypothetical protein